MRSIAVYHPLLLICMTIWIIHPSCRFYAKLHALVLVINSVWKSFTQAFLEFCKKKNQPVLDFMSFDSRQNHRIFCGCLQVLLRMWRRAPVLCHCRNPRSICSRQVRHCLLIWDWQFGVVQLQVVSSCRFQYCPRSFLMFSSSAVPLYYVILMHFHSWETS